MYITITILGAVVIGTASYLLLSKDKRKVLHLEIRGEGTWN
jgi:hypothetical protein